MCTSKVGGAEEMWVGLKSWAASRCKHMFTSKVGGAEEMWVGLKSWAVSRCIVSTYYTSMYIPLCIVQ